MMTDKELIAALRNALRPFAKYAEAARFHDVPEYLRDRRELAIFSEKDAEITHGNFQDAFRAMKLRGSKARTA